MVFKVAALPTVPQTLQKILCNKTVNNIGIWTQIVIVEGEHDDHLSSTLLLRQIKQSWSHSESL